MNVKKTVKQYNASVLCRASSTRQVCHSHTFRDVSASWDWQSTVLSSHQSVLDTTQLVLPAPPLAQRLPGGLKVEKSAAEWSC